MMFLLGMIITALLVAAGLNPVGLMFVAMAVMVFVGMIPSGRDGPRP